MDDYSSLVGLISLSLVIITTVSFFLGKISSYYSIEKKDKERCYVDGFMLMLLFFILPLHIIILIDLILGFKTNLENEYIKINTIIFLLLFFQMIISLIVLSLDMIPTKLIPKLASHNSNHFKNICISSKLNYILRHVKNVKSQKLSIVSIYCLLICSLLVLLPCYFLIKIYIYRYVPIIKVYLPQDYSMNIPIILSVTYVFISLIALIAFFSEKEAQYPDVTIRMTDGSKMQGQLSKFEKFVILKRGKEKLYINEDNIMMIEQKSD